MKSLGSVDTGGVSSAVTTNCPLARRRASPLSAVGFGLWSLATSFIRRLHTRATAAPSIMSFQHGFSEIRGLQNGLSPISDADVPWRRAVPSRLRAIRQNVGTAAAIAFPELVLTDCFAQS